MKKIIALAMALLMLAAPALAESTRVFAADTDSGAVLIDENGALITQIGDYDVIDLISYDDCPPERQLFMVSMLDLSDGLFLGDDFDTENWDDELDDVDDWPDTEGLDDGYDMEIVDDMPVVSDMAVEDDAELLDGDFLDGDVFGSYMDYGVALMNARGELLTDFSYIGFQHDVANSVVAAYDFDGFVTMLDEQGNVLLSGGYASAVSNGNGGFMAIEPAIDASTGDFAELAPVVYIAPDGSVNDTGFSTFVYEPLPGYADGLMCIPVHAADGEYAYVYIDSEGNDAFGASYSYGMNFVDGYAEVMDEYYNARLINTSGGYVTDGEYSYFDIGYAGDNMPIIANLPEGGFELISKTDGSVIASFLPETEGGMLYAYQSGDGLIMAYSEERTMIIDRDGTVLHSGEGELYTQTWYEYADSTPGRILLSDFTGDVITMCIADFDGNPASSWYSDIQALSWLENEGRYLVLDYELIEVEYDDETGYEPDMDTCLYGVIDHDGNVVVDIAYDYFSPLAPDRYWAARDGVYSLMDSDGNVLATVTE